MITYNSVDDAINKLVINPRRVIVLSGTLQLGKLDCLHDGESALVMENDCNGALVLCLLQEAQRLKASGSDVIMARVNSIEPDGTVSIMLRGFTVSDVRPAQPVPLEELSVNRPFFDSLQITATAGEPAHIEDASSTLEPSVTGRLVETLAGFSCPFAALSSAGLYLSALI
jgi:hypothetical protein